MPHLESYQTVKRWTGRISPNTAHRYLFHMNNWYNWIRENGGKFADYTPDELIEFAENANRRELFELCDLIQGYIESKEDLRKGSKITMQNSLRSFFAHNRAPLPKDVTFKPKGDNPKVVGNLTVEHIKQVVTASNILYQALFLVMFQGGFGRDEFIWWNEQGYRNLAEQLRLKPNGPLRVNLPDRKSKKNDYNYYTFIYGDGLKALKRYLYEVRPQVMADPQAVNKDLEDVVFISQKYTPLASDTIYRYWHNRVKKLGYAKPNSERIKRYGYNLHETRDVFRTQFRKSEVDVSYAEFFMGHSNAFDKDGYDKVYRDLGFTSGKYVEASPYLQIMTSQVPFGLVKAEDVENQQIVELKAQVASLSSALAKVMAKIEENEE